MINFSDRERIADPKSSPTRWRYTGLNRPEGSKNPYRKLISVCLCFSSFINITFTVWSRNLVIGDEFDIVDILVVVFLLSVFLSFWSLLLLGVVKCVMTAFGPTGFTASHYMLGPLFHSRKKQSARVHSSFFETLFIWFFQDDIMECPLYKR